MDLVGLPVDVADAQIAGLADAAAGVREEVDDVAAQPVRVGVLALGPGELGDDVPGGHGPFLLGGGRDAALKRLPDGLALPAADVSERLAAAVRARPAPPVELEGSPLDPVLLARVPAGHPRRVGPGEVAPPGVLELAGALHRLVAGPLAQALPTEVPAKLILSSMVRNRASGWISTWAFLPSMCASAALSSSSAPMCSASRRRARLRRRRRAGPGSPGHVVVHHSRTSSRGAREFAPRCGGRRSPQSGRVLVGCKYQFRE